MGIAAWVQTNFLVIGSVLAWIHMGLGIFGNITKSKTLNGIDDLVTNILSVFFKGTTPPNA